MTRVLFVPLPLAGHVNPASGIAARLAEDGHEVAWAGSELVLRPILGPDAVIQPTGSRLFREQGGSGIASIRSLWTRFVVPYAKFLVPGVTRAVREFAPDVVVVDQHAIGGALVAHREGVPWATLACSAMELTEPYRELPKLAHWQREHLLALWNGAGLPADEFVDLRHSPHLVLAQTTPLLAGAGFPEHVRLVGPLLAHRAATSFPFDRLDPDRRRVLVSMGTLADGLTADFHSRVLAAVARLDVQAIVVAQDLPDMPDVPDNVIVVPRVPMLELLPHVDALVGHAGVNTTLEALAAGLPLVLAPIRHDQPEMARQVVAAGAAVRLRFRRSGPDQITAAITAVLDDPSYRVAVARVAESIRSAGGTTEAAFHIVGLQQTMAEGCRSLSDSGSRP